MQIRHKDVFTAIRTEGAVLPSDLLQRIADNAKDIPCLTPEAYHLSGERVNEAVNRSWLRMQAAWKSFSDAAARLPENDPATGMTREKLLLPLFQELGYGRLMPNKAMEIDGKSYPISHFWHLSPIHLVGAGLDLDRRTAGAAGAARMSPHAMVQEFLNRSDAHLWAFVSNGLRLRILRDSMSLTRQAYVEFDLEAMMEGQAFADFVLLWLLCHQSRVEAGAPEDCILEQWSRLARNQGTRALDQLRSGVEAAISAVGEGFLAHPDNRELREQLKSGALDRQEYYRLILRFVYRLIFLFVAEDRDLLLTPESTPETRDRYFRYYSGRRLRELAGRQRGARHSDLYRGLRVVMEKLGSDEGCPELGLPALGGMLFSAKADDPLADGDISNQHFLKAVRAVSVITFEGKRRAVDYKNLGAEELGGVYESLLELHPVINADAGSFRLEMAGGNERKTTGSYYTHSGLVQCLLESALDPVLDEAARAENAEEAILNLKICDPACGSGHFLVAAAHRVAKRLAAVRTGDEEPSPAAVRLAVRDVIGRCIYGVDINPMAVELCKVSLWLEAMAAGKPLSFLDHHIQCGNSLLGTTPALLEKGIPDEAFKPIEGDDKKFCSQYRQINKRERGGQMGLFDEAGNPWDKLGNLAAGFMALDDMNDDSIQAVRKKQKFYENAVKSNGYLFGRLWADAWCAAFVWLKRERENIPYPVTEEVFRRIEQSPWSVSPGIRDEVARLASEYRFFHWHLAFPEVFRLAEAREKPENAEMGWNGGFDAVLGNPPWERVKLQEKEFYASVDPEIATAPNAARRKKLINALQSEHPVVYQSFLDARRRAEGISHLLRSSGRYPLCGRGDINTYTVFTELKRSIISPEGRVGCVVPSGIATDDTTKFFFQDLMEKQTLVSFYDFENRKKIFPEVDSRIKFCLLTMAGVWRPADQGAEFVFFAHKVEDLKDKERRFILSAEDIVLLNPNTKTCPIFRTKRDADLTKQIYQRVPVLIKEGPPVVNQWRIRFLTMFHMTNDSNLFKTKEQLTAEGWNYLSETEFEKCGRKYLPLYEAKMIHHFDHRFATFESSGGTKDITEIQKVNNPFEGAQTRYWVPKWHVINKVVDIPRGILHLWESFISAEGDNSKKNARKNLCNSLIRWIAGYYLNHDEEKKGEKLLQKTMPFTASIRDNMLEWVDVQSFEQNFPLDEEDVQIIEGCIADDMVFWMKEFIERKIPKWIAGWRDICRNTDERTVISTILPLIGVGNNMPLMIFKKEKYELVPCLISNLSSFVLDFIARFKVGGTHLNFFVINQIPIFPPQSYLKNCKWSTGQRLSSWLVLRSIELFYTTYSLSNFAIDCGYTGSPFKWVESRRFTTRCELDAAYFHLYGIERDDVDYIMETFPIVKRKDVDMHGHFRTKDVILDIYDDMAECIRTGQTYQTRLDPPPGDPRAAHPARENGETPWPD